MKMIYHSLKVLALFLFFAIPLHSQPVTNFSKPEQIYPMALELFYAQKYSAALPLFEQVQNLSASHSLLADDAGFFIPVCKLEMGNDNGRVELESFVTKNPSSSRINDAYLRLGSAEFNQKKYAQALTRFQKVDRYALSAKDLEEYLFKSAFCQLQAGNNDIAKVSFAELKDRKGSFADASKYYYGHICYTENKYDLALKEFNQIASNAQYSSIIPYYKIQIDFAQQNDKQVVAAGVPLYNNATPERKTELAKAIGVAYYRLKQYNAALPYVADFLNSTSITPLQYYVAGFCYAKANQTDLAIVNLEKAAGTQDALGQNANYELAPLYLKKGDKKKAMRSFQMASDLKFDPKIHEDALFQYARITYELNYSPFNEAIKAFDRYIAEFPNAENNQVAYDYLTKVFMTTRNYKDALVSLDKIKVKNPAIKKAYQRVAFNRGIELFRDSKYTEAIDLFNKSLLYADQSLNLKAQAFYWRGEANYRSGKQEEAFADYKRFQAVPGALKLKEYPLSNYNIGYYWFNKEDYQAAIAGFNGYLSKADKSSNVYGDALNRLGDSYFALSQFREALDFYRKSFETALSDADYALFQQAFCYGLLQDHRQKVDDLTLLQQKFPQSSYLDDALFETGRAWERLNDNAKAIASYKSLLEKYPSSAYQPKALVQLGLIAYNQDQFDASIGYYKEVIEKFPASPEAKGAMNGLKNCYMETNRVNEYIAFAKKTGQSSVPSVNEQDSLTYAAAEKLYMSKDARAKEALGNYLTTFPSGSFLLPVHFYKAELDLKDNDLENALLGYDYVLVQPENLFTENALLRASDLAYQTGDFQKALTYYDRLETSSSNTANQLIALAGKLRANYELKNFDQVAKIGWKIRSMDKIPQELDREACFKSAKAYVELKDEAKAIPLWRKLSADPKTLEGAEAKYHVCEYLYTNNKLKEAEDEVMNFIDKNTPHQYWLAKSFIILAKVYDAQNDQFQATNTLKSLIENYEQKNDGIVDEANDLLKTLESKPVGNSAPVQPVQKKGSTKRNK